MKQVLYQPEGTEEPANEPPTERAHRHQDADDVKGELIVPAADDRLKGTDGAGPQCTRAGVAVQARYTDSLRGAGVDFRLEEPIYIAVGQRGEDDLYPEADTLFRPAVGPCFL